jgi:glucan phosphoethanolaminetransferase (alkaline phosphatase superfamily)
MKKTNKSAIQAQVMKQIISGEVRMRPKIYFSMLGIITVCAGVAGGLMLAYVVSLASYTLRIASAATPAYGARENLAEALLGFPWWLVVFAAAFIALAVWLMRRYGHMYRYNTAWIVTVFVVVSLLLGVGLSFTELGHSEGGLMRGRGANSSHR